VRRAAHIALAGIMALLMLAAPSDAGSNLIRLTDRADLLRWEAVGRIDLEGGAYCTGVLIASHLVLTAAHCVHDRQGHPRPPESMRFRAGLADGKALAERRIARLVAHPGYDPTMRFGAEVIRHDVALLELAELIPTSIADPFIVHQGAGNGQRVSVVSYGQGRDEALSWQRNCSVLGRGQGLIGFDCDVTHGSSGAPVFVQEHGRTRILTLISGGTVEGGTSRAFGMDLPPLVERLKRDLRAIPVALPASGEIRRVRVGEQNHASGAKFAKP
jgi:protease YdgD